MSLDKNGWTRRQYVLFRAALGLYLAWHFTRLVYWGGELFSAAGTLPDPTASPLWGLLPNVFALASSPLAASATLALGATLGLALAAGVRDRAAAAGLWYLWACALGRNPLIANPSIPYVGWLLLAHAAIPSGEKNWRLPQPLFAAAWAVLALGYSYSGAYKLYSASWLDGTALSWVLQNPLARPGPLNALLLSLPPALLSLGTWGALLLETAYAPLALSKRLRPWLWLAAVLMHASLIVLVDFADLSAGMLLIHLFTFDPAWISPRRTPATFFYDAECGFCDAWVRFLAEEDRGGLLTFAPLGGETYGKLACAFPPADTAVLVAGGETLVRSDAALAALARLGGLWTLLARAFEAVPKPLRDAAYDAFAARRAAASSCRPLPRRLKARFAA
ncbi:MAG: DUF393 domain-containing protein [Elusimicrobia bacterium]|nr:DUF393 domain-containing protein [Elusimicrobiota bacterium]